MKVLKKAAEWVEEGRGFAMATIIVSKGSTPRHQAKMLIREDGMLVGTIGGGPGEFKVVQDALEALTARKNTVKEYIFDKNAEGGLPTHCGGTMQVLIEVFPEKRRIVLVGAGHVNQAVMKMAHEMNWRIVVCDDRPEYATQALLTEASGIYAHEKISEAIRLAELHPSDICIIATKDCDLEALREAVKHKPQYLGMIGSKRKVHKVFETLMEEGVSKDTLDKVHAPIGLNIGAETPFEIAISIMAEVIKVQNQASGKPMTESRTL